MGYMSEGMKVHGVHVARHEGTWGTCRKHEGRTDCNEAPQAQGGEVLLEVRGDVGRGGPVCWVQGLEDQMPREAAALGPKQVGRAVPRQRSCTSRGLIYCDAGAVPLGNDLEVCGRRSAFCDPPTAPCASVVV
jgi:hypothetical protein